MNIRRLMTVFGFCVLLFAMVEGLLRLQQFAGPVYDLEFGAYSRETLSDTLNHVPPAHISFILDDPAIYGASTGKSSSIRYDTLGIRINTLRPSYVSRDLPVSILFLGDSFLQGYDDANTIPQHVWRYFQDRKPSLRLNLYNAGWSSYSPAIFIPQATQLIPRLQPDLVVIIIDETDLGDDTIRYQPHIVRDVQGRIAAVRATPLNTEIISGFVRIRETPLYTYRLIKAFYFTWFSMPEYIRKNQSIDPRDVLSFSRDTDLQASRKYASEIQFFERTVEELAKTVAAMLGDPRRVLFVSHPHLYHLKPDTSGTTWNTFVSDTVQRVALRRGIPFYDATDDMRIQFGNTPERYYWSGDMHFTFDGLEYYGTLIARQLEAMIERNSD